MWKSCGLGELQCGRVVVWVSRDEGELHCGRVLVWSRSVRMLWCGRVVVWGSCSVGELWCGGVALWGSLPRKRRKISKFQLQILLDNLKSYSKCNIFFNIKEKMTELWCFKEGSSLPIPIFQLPQNDVFHRNRCHA